jgi:hypothetical protein
MPDTRQGWGDFPHDLDASKATGEWDPRNVSREVHTLEPRFRLPLHHWPGSPKRDWRQADEIIAKLWADRGAIASKNPAELLGPAGDATHRSHQDRHVWPEFRQRPGITRSA